MTHRATAQEAARRAALQPDAGQDVGLDNPGHCCKEDDDAQHDQRGQHGPHGQPGEEVHRERDVGGRHHSKHNSCNLQSAKRMTQPSLTDTCRHMIIAAVRAILQSRSLGRSGVRGVQGVGVASGLTTAIGLRSSAWPWAVS